MKEPPSLPRCRPVAQIDLTRCDPPFPPKDDIVGWPDELLIDFPDFPDFTLDSVANTPAPESARCSCLFQTAPKSQEITPSVCSAIASAPIRSAGGLFFGSSKRGKVNDCICRNLEGNTMSYSDARNHFEKARMNTADAVTIEMLDGLKHLSHAIEEDIRKLEQNIRDIQSANRQPTS